METAKSPIPAAICGWKLQQVFFFVGLFTAEFLADVRGVGWHKLFPYEMKFGLIPWKGWVVFICLAICLSHLLAASLCDIQSLEIPLPITITGTLFGLVLAPFTAWPFPSLAFTMPQIASWEDLIRKSQIPRRDYALAILVALAFGIGSRFLATWPNRWCIGNVCRCSPL